MDKSSSLGMPMSPQEIFKRYKRQSLGMPKASPSSSTKYQVIFQCAIFLLLHMICVVLGASLFLFLVFFCFVFCNKWLDPSYLVWERDTLCFFLEYSCSSLISVEYSIFALFSFQLLVFMYLLFRAISSFKESTLLLHLYLFGELLKQVDWCWRRVNVSCLQ